MKMLSVNGAAGIRWLLGVAAVLGALALLAGGCGGGGDEPSGSTGKVASGEGREGDGAGAGKQAGRGDSANGAAGGGEGEGAGPAGGSNGNSSSGPEGSGGGGAEGGGGSQQGSSGGGSAKARSGGKKGKSRKKGGSSGGAGGGGGGSGGAGGGGGSGGEAQFISEADKVCKQWGISIRESAERGVEGDLNGTTKQQRKGVNSLVAVTEEKIIPSLEAEMRDIRSLDTPPSAAGASSTALAAIQKLLDSARSDPEELILQGSAIAEAERLAKAQGFKVCGTLVGEPSAS